MLDQGNAIEAVKIPLSGSVAVRRMAVIAAISDDGQSIKWGNDVAYDSIVAMDFFVVPTISFRLSSLD